MAFGFTMSTAFIRMESRNDIVKYLYLTVKVLCCVLPIVEGRFDKIRKAVKDSLCPLFIS